MGKYNRYCKHGSGVRMHRKTEKDWSRKQQARAKIQFDPFRIFRILRAMMFGPKRT